MSALNYSKWDNINDDDDDNEEEAQKMTQVQQQQQAHAQMSLPAAGAVPSSLLAAQQAQGGAAVATKPTRKSKQGRFKFEHEGRTIYEWEQSLEEVNIYIEPPPNLPRQLIDISIQHTHLTVGVRDTPPFIDEDTWGPIKVAESMWTLADGEININLQKMNKAEAWSAALRGRGGAEVDALTQEEVKKQLMKERFQEEHPGFDFSGADFNGEVPAARDFMGGVKHF
jgi:hypothetical protein